MKERQLFEAAMKETGVPDYFFDFNGMEYASPSIQSSYFGWTIGRAALRAELDTTTVESEPVGEVVWCVPIEVTHHDVLYRHQDYPEPRCDNVKLYTAPQPKPESEPVWISVADRLPDTNTDCIVYMPSRGSVMVCKYFNTWSLIEVPSFAAPDITHWMPLPAAPQTEPIVEREDSTKDK